MNRECLQLLYICLTLYAARRCRIRQQEQEEEEKRKKQAVRQRRLQGGYRRPSRLWARSWLLRRPLSGNYAQLMAELQTEDKRGFKNYTRIKPELFSEIVDRLRPRLKKNGLPCEILCP